MHSPPCAGRAGKGREMTVKLSKAQVRALTYMSGYPEGKWVSGTPVTQKCLNVLHDKGLVDVAYEMGKPWERLTNIGRQMFFEWCTRRKAGKDKGR